ncbi:MAG TPA: CYCXC family (seleno)protein [Bryobacteraceae bacterium]|nr:CYCXC family (seleno)protein [Bryobacteraceae bacterium]
MRYLLLLVAALSLVSCASENSTLSTEETSAPVPAFFQSERDAAPLPKTLSASLFADPHLSKVYEIAERIPAILAQQPCYCYCDRGHGHRSLLDCQRDNHSAGCVVCRKEVLLADRLSRMGLSAKEIRAAIVRGDWKQVTE